MSVKTYDPKQVVVLVAGIPIGGFADGSAIKVARTSDTYNKSAGFDGVTSRVKTNDKSGMITLTLAQTSPSNDVLTGFANSPSNADTFPVMIQDAYGTSIYSSPQAWVKKPADVEFGKDITNREWVLDCADLDMFNGGSTIDES